MAEDRNEVEGEDPNSIKELVSSIKEHGGASAIKDSIDAYSDPDGTVKKGDEIYDTDEAALARLKELIEVAKGKVKKEKAKKMWDFRTSPHEHFGKLLDDTFMAFLLWARTDADDNSEGVRKINVSKAFRRLETYAVWMDETNDDLITPPLTPESVQSALEAWAMSASVDNQGRLVWWFDFSSIDTDKIKKEIKPEDSLRAFVWYAHYVMYDKNAQENGVVFVENVAKMGMVKMFTMIPMKLSTKLDKLTIGVLPVKMNVLYLLETPRWINLFMKFMGMFMSKKIKERIVALKEWSQIEEFLGKDCVPKGFGKLEGSIEVDQVKETYFS